MNRFYVQKQDIAQDFAVLHDVNDVKHISRVLRLYKGEQILLCDGEANEYLSEITEIEKDRVQVKILSVQRMQSELPCRVTLYQGLPKAGKMELIIQKCVELGVSDIRPVLTQRSVVRPDEDFPPARLVRYNKVAQEAAKQCGRGILPLVHAPQRLSSLDLSHHELLLIPDEEERVLSLKAALQNRLLPGVRDIAVLIGPEGGFEREEVERVRAFGGVSVTLGKRILRTETAGMAVLAMLMYELEG